MAGRVPPLSVRGALPSPPLAESGVTRPRRITPDPTRGPRFRRGAAATRDTVQRNARQESISWRASVLYASASVREGGGWPRGGQE